MTREYPLTGVGVGSYRILAPDYQRAIANETLPLETRRTGGGIKSRSLACSAAR